MTRVLGAVVGSLALGSTVALAAGCTGGAPLGEDPMESWVTQDVQVCPGGPLVRGIDVSRYQGVIDWPRVKAAGIEFAFIRVSDGIAVPDTRFAANWAGAKQAGVLRGVYQFFRTKVDPVAQANLLIDMMGPLDAADLSPVLDMEDTSATDSAAQIEANARLWMDRVTAATGRVPIIYTGTWWWGPYMDGADMTEYVLWHAQYPGTQPVPDDACPNIPAPWASWGIWQYSSRGVVDGVPGGVDLDRFNGTREQLLTALTQGVGTCGDSTCSPGESTETCPADCPPCGVIAATGGEVDDGDACFTSGGPAQFLRAASDAGEGGDLVWTHATDHATQSNFADWDLFFAEAGEYEVEVYTDARYAQSKLASYIVRSGDSESAVEIDQTAVDGWQSLGTFMFDPAGRSSVHLADNTGEPGAGNVQLVFDAVRLTRIPITPPVDPPIDPSVPRDSSGCASTSAPATPTFGLLIVGAVMLARRRRRP